MKDFTWKAIAVIAILMALWVAFMRPPRDCRVEAMNPMATVIVKLDRPHPCDLAAMAIEARAAVKAALEEDK